jgi:hypothetical protein
MTTYQDMLPLDFDSELEAMSIPERNETLAHFEAVAEDQAGQYRTEVWEAELNLASEAIAHRLEMHRAEELAMIYQAQEDSEGSLDEVTEDDLVRADIFG